MSENVRMKVLGLTMSEIKNGAYALILEQVNGPYRVPVVIGVAEAQAIAIVLEGVKPPRPMTHDLFESFRHAFGIEVKQIWIYKFEDGIFYSEIEFESEGRNIKIDARTSDAVSIALRCQAPIYMSRSVLDETGFIMESDRYASGTTDGDQAPVNKPKIENLAVEELEKELKRLIENEEYEKASYVRKLIENKSGRSDDEPHTPDVAGFNL